MRLDTHLHVMLKPFYGRPATDPDELLSSLAECGLDGGWISSIDALTTTDLAEQRRANDGLAEQLQRIAAQMAATDAIALSAVAECVQGSVLHMLDAVALAVQAGATVAGGTISVITTTPDGRTYRVAVDLRTLAVAADVRRFVVAAEDRVLLVDD